MYNVVKHLPGDIILNQGPTSNIDSVFNEQNFLLDDTTYSMFNWFTLEYTKSIWLKLFYERYLYTNQYDFFKELKNNLYNIQPQNKQQVYNIITNLVPQVDNHSTTQWLDSIGLFQGKINNPLALSCIIFSGSMYEMSHNNPDKIIPLLIARTPGRLILGEKITVDILDKKQVKVFSTNYYMRQQNPNVDELEYIQLPQLSDGIYDVILTYKDLQYKTTITIGNYIPERNTAIKVMYDSSVPDATRKYIDKLIADINPIYDEIIGKPMSNTTLTITYNPNGYATLSNNMTALNITQLPQSVTNDPNFDAFFLIEYSIVYYRGIHIPITQLRFNESIGQSLKVIVGNILNQRNIRTVNVKDINYYLNVFNYTNLLDAGILTNHGININDNYPFKYLLWDAKSKYMPIMNVFTLDYHYLPIWLKLYDARIKYYNKNDFFKQLFYAASQNKINNIYELYDFVDKYCKVVDNKNASEWLQNVAIMKDISNQKYFLDILPIRGDDLFNIMDIQYPTKLYVFLVKRDPYADIIEQPVKIKIYQNNELRLETVFIPGIDDYEYDYLSLPIR